MNIGYIVLLCIVEVGLFATKSLITFALFCFGMHIVFKNKNKTKKQRRENKMTIEEMKAEGFKRDNALIEKQVFTKGVKPIYKPFESLESLADAVKKHGEYVKESTESPMTYIIGMGIGGDIIVNGTCGLIYLYPPENFLNTYVFVSDGSPCGELVEE